MRFRNPKTGEVYTGEALAIAWLRFCLERNDKWVKDNPREAARLMGYEVVEEKYDSSGTCGICEKSTPNGYDGDIVCSITGESGKSEDKCKLREANMDKPLKDWTLGEVKAYCTGRDCYKECILAESPGKCKLLDVPPSEWDFEVKPRFTEQEVADAKTLCRMWPNGEIKFTRATDGDCTMVQVQGSLRGCLGLGTVDLFPSIKPGESYILNEIAGGSA